MTDPQTPIPTHDAREALAFCRRLSAWLADGQPPGPPAPVLSVVLPVHNEVDNLAELDRRLRDVLAELGETHEVIWVNDGSTDGSLDTLLGLARDNPHATVIDLARNFGHQVAISAGIEHARGDAVIIMDADLEDPPEVLPQFIAAWREGNDVVYAIREKRKEGWPKRVCYKLFYRLLQWMARIDIPLDAGDFCVMDRKVVDLLNRMPERNRFVRGIRSWVGLRQKGIAYERHARHAGKPSYNFRGLLTLALDGFISFSHMPLRIAAIMGMWISLIAILMALGFVAQKLTTGLEPKGYASTITAIFFFAGINLLTLGVIGEYIGRIFDEVKQRPLYVVRARHRGGRGEPEGPKCDS